MRRRVMKLGNVVKQVLTISEFAKVIGRSVETVRKMEDRGIMPQSNYRMPPYKDGRQGPRVYTLDLALSIKSVMEEVSQGREITLEQRAKIASAFENEKNLTNATI
jgi:hypothetical protein